MIKDELVAHVVRRTKLQREIVLPLINEVLAVIQEGIAEGGFYCAEIGGIYPYESGGKPHGCQYVPSNGVIKAVRAMTRGGPPPEPPEDSRASTGGMDGRAEQSPPDQQPSRRAPSEGSRADPSPASRNGRRPSGWLRGSSDAPESPLPSAPRRAGDDQSG